MQFAGKQAFMQWPPYQRAADDNLAASALKRIINSLITIKRGKNAECLIINTLAAALFHVDAVNLLLCH